MRQPYGPVVSDEVHDVAFLRERVTDGSTISVPLAWFPRLAHATAKERKNWRLIARWNQSLRDDQLLEAFGGLEYESCCYAVRVLARRYVRNFEGELNNGIMFELELKGLGSLGRRTEDFLSRAMLGLR